MPLWRGRPKIARARATPGSRRPGFVLPGEKMDGECQADDDLGTMKLSTPLRPPPPPSTVGKFEKQDSEARSGAGLVGEGGRVVASAGRVAGGRGGHLCPPQVAPDLQPLNTIAKAGVDAGGRGAQGREPRAAGTGGRGAQRQLFSLFGAQVLPPGGGARR